MAVLPEHARRPGPSLVEAPPVAGSRRGIRAWAVRAWECSSPILPLWSGAILGSAVLLVGAASLGNWQRWAIALLFSDPATYAALPPYAGAMSNLGILGWATAASVCLFSAGVSRRLGVPSSRVLFLAASGCLTSILLLDDMFLLHEALLPWYLGVPEALVLAGYALTTVGYLALFAAVIARTAVLPLAAACIFFAMSILADEVLTLPAYPLLFEDSFKFLGIVSWAIYFTHTSAAWVAEAAGDA